ncbi:MULTISPECIES: RNA polymerase sigma-70 factor [Algoriphagus]|uniref:RNA polymerase sigma-70 factor n=1 Tax=Algoriphagus TaxID=246875 RepID=UPI0011AAF0AC|nr:MULTISPECIES: RNA polymerase sigma-70 factor [Algoriphagus]
MTGSQADNDTWRLILEGNEDAFTELYLEFSPVIKRLLVSYLKSEPLAEDLSQEVFLQLWEERNKLGPIITPKAWLVTCARHKAFNFLKRCAVDQAAKSEILRSYPVSHTRPDEDLTLKDYFLYIEATFQRMPEQTRRIFKKCREEYKTYDEVAAELNITRDAVKKHMVRSMKILRETLERDLGITLTIYWVVAVYSPTMHF